MDWIGRQSFRLARSLSVNGIAHGLFLSFTNRNIKGTNCINGVNPKILSRFGTIFLGPSFPSYNLWMSFRMKFFILKS